MPSTETDLIDVVRVRLQGVAHELDGVRALAQSLADQTRWRSRAFPRFTEHAVALIDELARIGADAEELRHDLLRARAATPLRATSPHELWAAGR